MCRDPRLQVACGGGVPWIPACFTFGITRMHSSRMRTVCYSGRHWERGVCPGVGRGVCPGVGRGVCPGVGRGVCPGGCLLGGGTECGQNDKQESIPVGCILSAAGGVCQGVFARGCLPGGISQHALRHTAPCERND